MDFRSEHVTADNGAQVELAAVIHNGHEFTHLGSVIDESAGLLIGYPSKDEKHLLTWDGKPICPLNRVSSRRQRCFHFFVAIVAYSCEYNGRHYTGRNQGSGMLLRLRAR